MCSTKIGYANALSLGKNSCKIRNVATLKSVHQAKKQCDFDSGWLERQQCNFAIYLDSSESCEPRRFVWCWMEQKWIYVYIYIQEQQPNQFHCYNQSWVLSTEWTRTWPGIGIRMKKWWWFPYVWMVDAVIQRAWVLYLINKDKDDDSFPLIAFWRHVVYVIFLKYSKEDRLSSSHIGIRNIPSDVCYDDTEHYQVQSEHRRILNPLK